MEAAPAFRGPHARAPTFTPNLRLPVHGWFRFPAGFSATWAQDVIAAHAGPPAADPLRVLDPFAGSGTTVLAAEAAGAIGLGVEAHPFVARVAQAKLAWRADPEGLRRRGQEALAAAMAIPAGRQAHAPLVRRCFPPKVLDRLGRLRRAVVEGQDDLLWLALVSILRSCSPVGTATWQYVLPKRRKARAAEPWAAFAQQVERIAADMETRQGQPHGPHGQILAGDARRLDRVASGWADLVVTSPPYANNYDYADATRLEMSFLGDVGSWGDLHAVRRHLVRSCTQHAVGAAERLDDARLDPLRPELDHAVAAIAAERPRRGGQKAYDRMAVAYLIDMADVWRALRRVVRPGGRACIVVGDSAPYGVHLPIPQWLGDLAAAVGFAGWRFEKLRDRNVKWDNRVHKVPLQEGVLWVQG